MNLTVCTQCFAVWRGKAACMIPHFVLSQLCLTSCEHIVAYCNCSQLKYGIYNRSEIGRLMLNARFHLGEIVEFRIGAQRLRLGIWNLELEREICIRNLKFRVHPKHQTLNSFTIPEPNALNPKPHTLKPSPEAGIKFGNKDLWHFNTSVKQLKQRAEMVFVCWHLGLEVLM